MFFNSIKEIDALRLEINRLLSNVFNSMKEKIGQSTTMAK